MPSVSERAFLMGTPEKEPEARSNTTRPGPHAAAMRCIWRRRDAGPAGDRLVAGTEVVRCTHLMSVLRAEVTAQIKGTDQKTGWRG